MISQKKILLLLSALLVPLVSQASQPSYSARARAWASRAAAARPSVPSWLKREPVAPVSPELMQTEQELVQSYNQESELQRLSRDADLDLLKAKSQLRKSEPGSREYRKFQKVVKREERQSQALARDLNQERERVKALDKTAKELGGGKLREESTLGVTLSNEASYAQRDMNRAQAGLWAAELKRDRTPPKDVAERERLQSRVIQKQIMFEQARERSEAALAAEKAAGIERKTWGDTLSNAGRSIGSGLESFGTRASGWGSSAKDWWNRPAAVKKPQEGTIQAPAETPPPSRMAPGAEVARSSLPSTTVLERAERRFGAALDKFRAGDSSVTEADVKTLERKVDDARVRELGIKANEALISSLVPGGKLRDAKESGDSERIAAAQAEFNKIEEAHTQAVNAFVEARDAVSRKWEAAALPIAIPEPADEQSNSGQLLGELYQLPGHKSAVAEPIAAPMDSQVGTAQLNYAEQNPASATTMPVEIAVPVSERELVDTPAEPVVSVVAEPKAITRADITRLEEEAQVAFENMIAAAQAKQKAGVYGTDTTAFDNAEKAEAKYEAVKKKLNDARKQSGIYLSEAEEQRRDEQVAEGNRLILEREKAANAGRQRIADLTELQKLQESQARIKSRLVELEAAKDNRELTREEGYRLHEYPSVIEGYEEMIKDERAREAEKAQQAGTISGRLKSGLFGSK